MNRLGRALVLAAIALVGSSCGARRRLPDAVVYTDKSFQLYIHGESFSAAVVRCDIPVEDFSVAPDGRSVVFTSVENAHAGAGLIYRLDFESRRLEKLIQAPFAFRNEAGSKERELYAIPEISPNGKLVAFATRSVAGDDSGDALGLAGPVAILNLLSKQTRILATTETIDGQGPAYVGSIAWSPDSNRLLLELETQGAIAVIDGSQLRRLESVLPARFREGQAAPLAWWSSSEVLFIWSPTELWNANISEIFRLDLEGGTAVGSDLLKQPHAQLRNVSRIDRNSQFVLITHQAGADLLTPSGDLVHEWKTSKVRLRPR